jgi:hypothetical protein
MKNLSIREDDNINIQLSLEELITINNSLNEVCYGVDMDDNEFFARVGVSHEDGVNLLNNFSALIRKIQNRVTTIAS